MTARTTSLASSIFFIKRVLIAIIPVLVIAALFFIYGKQQMILAKYEDFMRPEPPVETEVAPQVPVKLVLAASNDKLTPPKDAKRVSEPVKLPETFNLKVPFTTQAPLVNWDLVHEDTCEETAVMMVNMYYKKLQLKPQAVEDELQKFVAAEKKMLGYFEDTTATETMKIANKLYGFKNSRILEKPTVDDLKKEVLAGRPVILPTNGKALKNPNFKNGGPPYHMIVLRGWNKDGFFVNDPGTRKGNNYFYTYATIARALHDWDGKAAAGVPRAIVLFP